MAMSIEELRALRDQLRNNAADVTDEQIQNAIAAIREHVAQARTREPNPELVAELEALAEVRDTVVEARDARIEAAAQNAETARDLLDGLDIPDPAAEPVADDTTADPTAQDGGEPTADTADTAAADTAPQETPVPEQADAPEPVLAAAGSLADAIARGIAEGLKAHTFTNTPTAPAAAADTDTAQVEGRTGRPGSFTNTVVAQAGGRDVAEAKVYLGSNTEHGRAITSELDVARAIHEKWKGAYQAKGTLGRMPVLTVDTTYPEHRILGSSVESNFEKIRNLTSPNALTAAGGLCAPLETLYDVEVIGSTARPIRDALPRFQVERGGIQFRPGLSAASAVNGAGVWTLEDDEASGSGGAVKDCWPVDCPPVEDAVIQAIYSCLEFCNISARFDPETTAANVRQGMIAHARLAERELYRQMAALSKLVVANPQVVGAVRHILGEMDKLIAYYRDRHRLDTNVTLLWLAPQWVRELLRVDIAYQMAAGDWQDALGASEDLIDGWFARRSVRPVWFLDGNPDDETVNGVTIPSQVYAELAAGDTIPAFPQPFDSLLFTADSFLFLDGGSLDLGLVRDSELNSRNCYQQFSETFEGIANRGVEPLRPVFDVCPTGASSGTVAVVCS